jgi:hypothetical protein
MDSQLKRTLSKIKPELNYHFICWFDLAVPVEEEIQEAKRHCNTNEVVCNHQPGHDFATVQGTGVSEEQNRMDVECVRSYLMDYHGWEEGEE